MVPTLSRDEEVQECCWPISLLERSERMPSLQVIKKLAAALETTMASLMEELEAADAGKKPGKKKG